MAAATTLDDAIKNAVQENPPGQPDNKEVQSSEKTETTETKITETNQPTTEETARTERLDKALRLYEALEDPNVGPAVLAEMVKKAGMVIQPANKKEEQQVTKTVVDVLKESLGTEYEFLADRLAPGLDKIVKAIVSEQVKPIQESNQQAIERAIVADIDSAYARAESRHKDFKEYDKEMMELSKELPYTGETPEQFDKYLDRLYKLASADKKEAKVIKNTVDKINKNSQELRDSSTEVQETRVTKGSKLPTLNEAVAAAFRNERLI